MRNFCYVDTLRKHRLALPLLLIILCLALLIAVHGELSSQRWCPYTLLVLNLSGGFVW
jgi:hypothetical protein